LTNALWLRRRSRDDAAMQRLSVMCDARLLDDVRAESITRRPIDAAERVSGEPTSAGSGFPTPQT